MPSTISKPIAPFVPFFSEEMAETHHIQLATKEEIYANADYISLHAPLLKETQGMINDESLAMCKDGVRIVNCARGELIDDECAARRTFKCSCRYLAVRFNTKQLFFDIAFSN